MQKFSTFLNVILLVAVAVLYYLYFASGKKNASGKVVAGAVNIKDTGARKIPVVAYVELDSLNANVNFIKQRKAELEAEQKSIVAEYEGAYQNLEAEKNNFLKRGNAITQQEAQAFQEKLMQKQQDIEAAKQAKGQRLAERGAKIMEDMQAKLKDFLNEYNKEKGYTYILATGTGLDYIFYKDSTLNITPEIVKGLNEKMNKSGK
ncbi:OmpH family outer membrane protein [Ferruginibacter lapsinanis]|uniref:OmpH family outer membrane protein n=1 Tax=Ferruginibacter lapsinanis TaxID=563172 RepID=UPI001E64AC88|nr:OmpH family outer membrane protein [Ferruginibacter lapsinanis]UEG48809.1 OmpH family outer membrane protein [Ferruginibacter lapsinanis]